MKFKNRIKQLKELTCNRSVTTKNASLYLMITIPIIINSLVVSGLIAYFSSQQNHKQVNNIVDNYTDSISDRLFSHLDNSEAIKDISYNNQKVQLFSQVLNKYLAQLNFEFSTKLIVINKDGSIVASNFIKSENRSSFTAQDVVNYLQQKIRTFSNPNQTQQFSFEINQQYFVGQVTPWQNKELGLNLLVIVAVSKSELVSSSVENRNDPKLRYLTYLLPSTLLGILNYIWITSLIKDSSQSISEMGLLGTKPIKNPINKINKDGNSEPSKYQNKPIVTTDKTVNYEPYCLLADMSHELRSPLNAILGFAQIMQQELSTTQINQENIAIINRNGEHLLSIINDVIDLAKIETNRLVLEHNNIDFHGWLDSIEQSFQFQARNQGWEFSLIRQTNLPQYICFDERRLRQILRNLIDYCLKSTPPVDVSLKVASSSSREKTVGTNQQNSVEKHNIYFEVENTDFSVPASELTTLFDPVVRVRQEQKSAYGSSLNLPISRKLAQLMGGDITVGDHSISSSGIIFNLEIQTESIVAEKLLAQSSLRRIIGLESDQIEYRILIVDDSKTNRQIMSQLLEPVGFKVQEAVNGQEAIDVWLRWQPHMIWMDLRMPVMNGYEATEKIKSYSQSLYTPIVALSASTLEEEKLRFKAAGCDDFVGKPFSEKIIFDKIAQHLGIRYIYESIPPLTTSNFKLTADSLNVMSNQWLNQVEQAAIVLDQDLLTQLLQTIPPEHTDLQNVLQKHVNNFDFDNILSLVRNSKSN